MLAVSEPLGKPSGAKALMSGYTGVFLFFQEAWKERELIGYFICYLHAQGSLATNILCDGFLR